MIPSPRRSCTRETSRCEFWQSPGQELQRPDCCTTLLRDILFFVAGLLAEHDIRYWLDYGTLLGAARERAFIPWDTDVDLGVRAADGARIRSMRDAIDRAGFSYRDRSDGCLIAASPSNDNHLDIFFYESDGGSLRNGGLPRYDFPERFVQNLQPIQLYGREFPAPSPLHEFLRDYRFGPAWTHPCRPVWSAVPETPFSEITAPVVALMNEISRRDLIIARQQREIEEYERSTELGARKKAVRDFVCGRTASDRFRRNLVLLHDTLDRAGFGQKYWVIGGLLLGWARERRILLHDANDADFGIMAEDRAAFLRLVPTLIAAGFRPQHRFIGNDGEAVEFRLAKDGAAFEFFVHVPAGGLLRSWFFGNVHGGGSVKRVEYVSEVPAYDFASMSFLGREWRKPDDHEAYLEAVYGDWRTPRPDYHYQTDDRSVTAARPWEGTMEWPSAELLPEGK
jgi:hypothetical protein